MPIVTASEVTARLGRDLTTAEEADVTNAVASAVEVIEARLHRTVEVGQHAERRTPLIEGMGAAGVHNGFSIINSGGVARVHLAHRPVASITSVVGVHTGTNYTPGCRLDGDTLLVPTQEALNLTYVAGDDPVSPLVKRIILKALTRELFLPGAVSAGAYSSYSVEGASFNANQPAPAETYPFNASEMGSLRQTLGRLVLR